MYLFLSGRRQKTVICHFNQFLENITQYILEIFTPPPLCPLRSIYNSLPTQLFFCSLYFLKPMKPSLCCSCTLGNVAFQCSMVHLVGTTILKKTDLPSSSSLELSIILCQRQNSVWVSLPPCWNYGQLELAQFLSVLQQRM